MAHHSLKLISNAVVRDRIAFSLVHARARIDVPTRCVKHVEARHMMTFFDEQGRPWHHPAIHIDVQLADNICQRIFTLTEKIVGEPLGIFVGDDCISKPVVLEPLARHSFFYISAHDFADAQALAARMRGGTAKAELRMV